MNVGMLWLDADKNRTFEEKVSRAADYYRDKYGRFPELCLVNGKHLAESKKVGRVRVESARSVLPDHFWMGMAS